MTDTALNRYLAQGDDAAEGAFTPDPATPASGPDPVVLFVNTESTAVLKYWDGMAFQTISGGGGSSVVVQVVNTQTGAVATGTTTMPLDNTIPAKTEGDEYMTLAITPTSASNKLRIDVDIAMSNSAGDRWNIAALFQDTTTDALAAGVVYMPTGTGAVRVVFSHTMTAGTTSATTFKVRAGGNAAGTTTVNGANGTQLFGGVSASSITITEYVP